MCGVIDLINQIVNTAARRWGHFKPNLVKWLLQTCREIPERCGWSNKPSDRPDYRPDIQPIVGM